MTSKDMSNATSCRHRRMALRPRPRRMARRPVSVDRSPSLSAAFGAGQHKGHADERHLSNALAIPLGLARSRPMP